MIGQLGVGHTQRSQETGNGHRGSSLDVVVERQVLVAVLLEEAESVVVSEVLKLDQSVLAVPMDSGLHELVDEIVVRLTGNSFLPQTNVVRIVEEFLNRVFIVGVSSVTKHERNLPHCWCRRR